MYRKIKDFFLDILYPRRCPVCGKIVPQRGLLICPDCIGKLSWIRQPLCKCCGKEIISENNEYCSDCAGRPRAFDGGMAVINYNELASRSMALIKYHNKREYLDFYTEAIFRRLAGKIRRLQPDALVPVPVHPARLKKRGFNQAEELARRLSDFLHIPVNTSMLSRGKNTLPQKALSPAERLYNLEKAFIAAKIPSSIHTILLVDDIYTTGSTVEACARVLKRNGAEQVYFVTIFMGSQR